MPEVEISIGGRFFEVACQEGEEAYLLSAAKLLDNEASALADQLGRLSEGKLLLMAGLMLADKTSGLQDKLTQLEEKLATQDQLLAELRGAPAASAPADGASDRMRALVARAEALATSFEEAS